MIGGKKNCGKVIRLYKKRIREGNCYNMHLGDFLNMSEIPFKSCFTKDCEDYIVLATRKGSNEAFADLIYKPDADFNYFITESCVCDGTYVFLCELITRIMQKIKQLETYYAPAIDRITEDNLNDFALHYYVGDFVINSHIIESPNEKPWLCDRFYAMLPVKFTVEKQ